MRRTLLFVTVMITLLAGPGAIWADLFQATGKVTFLRVNELGDKFGPIGDQIEAEVVIKLNTKPDQAFGFELRNDDNRPVRQGMLDLLRDAFNNGWTVKIDYRVEPPKKNGIITRLRLIKAFIGSSAGDAPG